MPVPITVYPKSEGQRFASDARLVVVSCATCFMSYAIPESLYRAAQAWPGDRPRGWKLCCPLGHTWYYTGESPDDVAERAKNKAAYLQASLDQAQASLRAQRGAATRARNQRDELRRAAIAGECPCCGKGYKYLKRHMDRIHPDFAEQDPDQ